jgi:hypothetical protein
MWCLAVLATLSTTRTKNLVAAGDSAADALTGGFHLMPVIGAGLVVVAIAAAATVPRPAEAEGALDESPGRRACPVRAA